MSSSDEVDDNDEPVVLAQDLVVLATELSPDLIRVATLSQLILVLPLVLDAIVTAHAASRYSPLIDPLCRRLHRSRRLKLRFLLLRHHPVFKSLPVKLRFSTYAYEKRSHQPYVSRTACSTSHLDLSLDRDEPMRITSIKVDLQSDDFYSNIIFRKFEVGSYQRAGLQLISHVFQPQTEDHASDEVCTPLYDRGDGVDEDGHHMTADTDGIAHMANVHVDRNETVVEICQAFGEVKAADDVKQVLPTKALVAPSSAKMSTAKISTPGLSSYGASVVANARRGGAPPWMSNGGRFGGIGSISSLPGLSALGSNNNNNPSPSTPNTDGSHTDGNNGSTAGSSKDEAEGESTLVMYPRMYLRTSDDVLRVQLVTLTLQLMNEVWRRHWSIDPLSAPFILTYDCVATGASKGLVQLIPKESRHVNTAMDDPIMIDQLIRSIAGAVTSGYVLGIHHNDLALRDGCTAFWRPSSSAVAPNFAPPVPGGGGVGGGPGGPNAGAFPGLFDISSASPDLNHALGVTTGLPKHVKTALKHLQAWDLFRRLCIQAFVVLRNAWHSVFAPVVVPMFVKCGIPQRQIEMYVHGKHSLYLAEKDDLQAQLYFRKCIS